MAGSTISENFELAGGCPAAGYFLLLRQKKVPKEKATPIRHLFEVPCVCSTGQAAAELALRAHRRHPLTSLRYSVADEGCSKRKSNAIENSKAKCVSGHFVLTPFAFLLLV